MYSKKVFIVLVIVLCALSLTMSNAAITEHTTLPNDINSADVSGGLENPRTSGLNFSVNTPGKLTKVRLWVASGRTGLHTVSVWDIDTGAKIAGPFEWQLDGFSNEWVDFTLPSPIDIEAGKSYGVAISDNIATFMSAIHGYWENHEPVSDVFATYYRGFSWNVDELPSNWNPDGTYMVDVVFTTGEAETEPTTEPTTAPTTEPSTINPETSDPTGMFFAMAILVVFSILYIRKLSKELGK